MVRNLKGGSGAKGQARKHTSTGSCALIKTRLAYSWATHCAIFRGWCSPY